MKNLFGIGLALAASASLAAADNGGPEGVTGNKAGTPTPFLADTKVSYKPGKGLIFDAGDAFSATLGHRIQAKWRFVNNENAPDTNGFRARRIRQKISGHIMNKDVTYVIQADHTEGTALKDAWLKWMFFGGDGVDLSLRLGQGKTRGGLESDGTSGGLFFVERSMASRTFADARARGALLEGTALDDDMLGFHFGAINTDSAASSAAANEEGNNNGEHEINFIAGARFSPTGSVGNAESRKQGDLAHTGELDAIFGANILVGNERSGGNDVEIFQFNVNAGVKSGTGIAGQAEVWVRSEDPDVAGGMESDSNGWYAQGSWTMPPEEGQTQYGFGARVSMVNLDDAGILVGSVAGLDGGSALLAGTTGDVLELNAVFNQFYMGHALKSQFGYTFQDVNPDGATSMSNHGIEFMVTGSF